MMSQEDMDKNLIIVVAIEGYSYKHNLDTKDVLKLFKENDLFASLRSQYEVLHTQSLDESVGFVEDVLARRPQ